MNGLKGENIEAGDRVYPYGSNMVGTVTHVGDVNDYGTRKVYYSIGNGLVTYGMDYQMRRGPASGPYLLDDRGEPTFAASIEKYHGCPTFWQDADDNHDAMWERKPSIGERYAEARRGTAA